MNGQGDLFGPYGNLPGHARTDTSIAGAKGIAPRAGELQQKVLAFLRSCGEDGATDEEIENHFGAEFSRATRPRRRELQLRGFVRDSGSRRAGRSGIKAIVWVASVMNQGPSFSALPTSEERRTPDP